MKEQHEEEWLLIILELEKEGSNMLLYCLGLAGGHLRTFGGEPLICSQNASLGFVPQPHAILHVTILAQPLFCPIKMLLNCCFKLLYLYLLFFQVTGVASKPDKPDYVTLPTLREQTAIQDAWTEQRISNIPNILNKYAVDAWLVRYYLSLQDIKLPPRSS